VSQAFIIKDLRVYLVASSGRGGDYFQQAQGHWVIDSLISNPMSGYAAFRDKRSSWGIGVLGSLVIEVETAAGIVGVATGHGGMPAAWFD
jgi:L-rhamnonate dehydratase